MDKESLLAGYFCWVMLKKALRLEDKEILAVSATEDREPLDLVRCIDNWFRDLLGGDLDDNDTLS